jgi:hypothetical protein
MKMNLKVGLKFQKTPKAWSSKIKILLHVSKIVH